MSADAGGAFTIEILGDAALLLRFGDRIDATLNASVHAVARALHDANLPGVRELVPAYSSVAVHYDPRVWLGKGAVPTSYEGMLERLREVATRALAEYVPSRAGDGDAPFEIPVCYGGEFGPDLDEVAEHARLSASEVTALHGAADYRVAMLGFAPGFPYLLGLDTRLVTPRRANPRTRVPVGSVASGGAQTGIYPRELPGGWRLIGRTPLRLFDTARASPALLTPGQRIRFRAIGVEEFGALAR